MNQMDVPSELKALLRRDGLTQSELAARAGVSQPMVSRAMRRVPVRFSVGYGRLCSYIRKELGETSLPPQACDALTEIWDGSPAHDAALAALIGAVVDLSRSEGTEERP